MKDAVRIYSWRGVLTEKVSARSVTSRERARQLGPFADPSGKRNVLWRSPSFDAESKRLKRRSCFAHYPTSSSPRTVEDERAHIAREVESERREKSESARHRKAQAAVIAAISDRLMQGLAIPWSYKDPQLAFPFSGNLIADAVGVEPNYRVELPSGEVFYLDVAILGPCISTKPIVLGGVEIEFRHEFSNAKCLLLRSLGFPLFSIDVTEEEDENLNVDWAIRALQETSWNSEDERRRNFVYLNDALAPLFVNTASAGRRVDLHKYLVFARDEDLERLRKWLNHAATKLGLANSAENCVFTRYNARSPQSRVIVENAGAVAGEGWRELNSKSFLHVQIQAPRILRGPLYQLHLLVARLVCSEIEALVGYRDDYCSDGPDDAIWSLYPHPNSELGAELRPYLPRRVGYPVAWILRELAKLHR